MKTQEYLLVEELGYIINSMILSVAAGETQSSKVLDKRQRVIQPMELVCSEKEVIPDEVTKIF